MRGCGVCARGQLAPAALTTAAWLAAGLAALLTICARLTVTTWLAAIAARLAIRAWSATITARPAIMTRLTAIAARGCAIAAEFTAWFGAAFVAADVAARSRIGPSVTVVGGQRVEHRTTRGSRFAIIGNPFVADILIARLAVAALASA